MAELVPIVTATFLLAALSLLSTARRSSLRALRDETNARLERIERRLERLERPTAEPEPVIDAGTAVRPSSPVPAADPPRTRVDPPSVSAVSGPTLIEVPSLAAAGSDDSAASAAAELAGRFGAIWSLADTGAGVDAIARATGQAVGQVELVLGLRVDRRRRDAAAAPVSSEAEHES